MLKTAVSGFILTALMSSLSIGTNLVLPTASSPEPVQTQVQVQEQKQIQAPVQEQVQKPIQEQVQKPIQEQVQKPIQEQVQKPIQEQPAAPEGNTDNRNYNKASCFYTDENGDGICDYCTLTSDCGLHGNCPSGYSGQTQRHHNSGCGNESRRGCHR